MDTFDTLWQKLLTHLKPGTTIPNWTAFRGYLGDEMTIVDVNKNYIEVEAPKAKNIQIVPKGEFEKVWKVWEKYKAHKAPRMQVRDMTMFSKYIISILHWYEQEV